MLVCVSVTVTVAPGHARALGVGHGAEQRALHGLGPRCRRCRDDQNGQDDHPVEGAPRARGQTGQRQSRAHEPPPAKTLSFVVGLAYARPCGCQQGGRGSCHTPRTPPSRTGGWRCSTAATSSLTPAAPPPSCWPGPVSTRNCRRPRPAPARSLPARRGGVLDADPQAVPHPGGRGLPEQRHGGVLSVAGVARRLRRVPGDGTDGPGGPRGLSHLGLRALERVPGSPREVHRLLARRARAGAQRDGGQQLHRERPRPRGRRRSADQRPGAPGRRAALEPARQALRDRGQEVRPAPAARERGRDPHPHVDALTPRTRVLFVSHITTTTGVVLRSRRSAPWPAARASSPPWTARTSWA